MSTTQRRSTRWAKLALIISVVATLAILSAGPASAATGTITTQVGTGAPGFGPWPGPGLAGNLSGPHGTVYDAALDSVFISDTNNCDVLKDDLTSGVVSVLVNAAAACGLPDPAGTPAAVAHLDHPHGLAINKALNLLYIADRDNHVVAVVNLSTMLTETPIVVFPGAGICSPVGVTVDQGSAALYVADQSCDVIWRVPFGGSPSIFAGLFNTAGFNGNGIPATTAKLSAPAGIDFVSGVLYLADTQNNEIRDVVGGTIFDVVGDPGALAGYSPDGAPATSPITAPTNARLDGGGTLFFDETGSDLVREVDASGSISTVAGTLPPGGTPFPYSGNPSATVALNGPHGITFVPSSGTNSDLWFSDTGNNVVDSVSGVASGAGFGSSPTVISASSATVAVGQPLSFLVTTGGSPMVKIKKMGALPKGVKFHDNHDGTASIAGTPTSTKTRPAQGVYPLTLTASFGRGKTKTVEAQIFRLNVTPMNDFAITVSPATVSVIQGSSTSASIATATLGQPQTVQLSVSGQPSGSTASPSVGSVSSGGSATLTFAAGTAAPGVYTLTITGTGTSAIHSTALTVTIQSSSA